MLAERDAGVALPDAKNEWTTSSVGIEVCELECSRKIGPIHQVDPRQTGITTEAKTVNPVVNAQHLGPDQPSRSLFAPVL